MEEKHLELDPKIPYDIVKLPSNGIFYKNKKNTLKVAYLNANDENTLISPNLVQSGELMDTIIREKVLDRDIDTKTLLECDKQAILIFLRNSAFGPEYEVVLPDSGNNNAPFTHTIDITSVPIKDFELVPDEKGEFDYIFPISKKNIKFKFLTGEEENEINDTIEAYENKGTKIIAPRITKRLEKHITQIDDNRDLAFIATFIRTMPINDSKKFRRYIEDNKPGLNLDFQVKAPSGKLVTGRVRFNDTFFRPFFEL